MTHSQLRLAPLTVLVLAAVAALLALPRSAWATNPCDGDDPPASCYDLHTETRAETLTVNPSAGTVTISPSGITCGTTCSTSADATRECNYYDCTDWTYPSFTLTASDGPAGDIPSWGGACSGSATTCTVTLSSPTAVSLAWLDVTDPSVSLTAPTKASRTLTVTASASDNAGVASVGFYVDGVLRATDTTAPYTATLDMSGYAQASTHTLVARATDTSGRMADASRSVTIDKVVGLTLGTLPAYTNATTLPLAVATDPDATLTCQLNGGAAAPCAGSFSPISAATPDGAYIYTVTATDDAGNTATGTRSVVLDRTAPAITAFDGPTEGQQVGSSSIAFSFTVADANLASVQCVLDAAAPRPCAGGLTLSALPAGTHRFTLMATDRAGNGVAKTRTFVVVAAPRPSLAGVRVTYAFIRSREWTKFTSLRLRGVPAGANVRISCHGRGCPRKASLKTLRGRRLRPGARIVVRVTMPGALPKVITLAVRRGRSPKVS